VKPGVGVTNSETKLDVKKGDDYTEKLLEGETDYSIGYKSQFFGIDEVLSKIKETT
jgi:hypothetical protein